MDVLKDFGKRIKELRINAGMTQEALAIRAELDRSYVGAIERGEKNVSLVNIEKLANAMGIDLFYLFEDERFATRLALVKKELKKPLDSRFTCLVSLEHHFIWLRITGPLSKNDVELISKNIKSQTLLLTKGEIRMLIDNRSMVKEGQPFVFTPEAYDVWEDLQIWLLPYLKKVAVLCNSKFMKNQLERMANRSGVSNISTRIYNEDLETGDKEAFSFLDITENQLAQIRSNSMKT